MWCWQKSDLCHYWGTAPISSTSNIYLLLLVSSSNSLLHALSTSLPRNFSSLHISNYLELSLFFYSVFPLHLFLSVFVSVCESVYSYLFLNATPHPSLYTSICLSFSLHLNVILVPHSSLFVYLSIFPCLRAGETSAVIRNLPKKKTDRNLIWEYLYLPHWVQLRVHGLFIQPESSTSATYLLNVSLNMISLYF